MARLALAVGAAVAGFAIGGPVGAQVGFAAGSIAGSLLFPQKGPKPQKEDTTVQAASYGTPIPIAEGTDRTAGTLLWVKGNEIDAKKVTLETGKGFGGGATGYAYFVTCAVLVCEGEIDGIRRIWADTKLIYDLSGDRLSDEIATGGTLNATAVVEGVTIRVHLGDETQLPDSLMEADLGSGKVPAHRGLAYVVFDNLPLDNFANRIPNFSFEYVKDGTTSYLNIDLTAPNTTNGGTGAHSFDEYAPYLWNADAGGYVTKWSLASGGVELATNVEAQLDSSGTAVNILGGGPVTDEFGNVYLPGAGNGTAGPVYKFDAATLVYRDHIGSLFQVTQWNYRSFRGGLDRWLFGMSFNGRLYVIDALTFTQAADNLLLGGILVSTPQVDMSPDMEFWVAYNDASQSFVRRVSMTRNPGGTYPWTLTLLSDTEVTDTFGDDLDKIHYYVDEGVVLLGGSGGSGTVAKFDPDSETILSSIAGIGTDQNQYEWRKGPVNGKLWGMAGASTFKELDLASMTITRSLASSLWASSGSTKVAIGYTPVSDALVGVIISNAGRRLLFLPRLDPLAVDRADVITDYSAKVGLEASDLDVSLVTDTVRGNTIRRQTTARGALEPIMQTGFLDAVDVDRKVKFVPRGQSAALTIPEDDLGASLGDDDVDRLEETIQQEVELPERVLIRYVNPDAEYDQGAQAAKRPREAISTREQVTVDFAEVMTDDTAKQLAEKLLYSAWQERTTLKFSLPRKYAKLVPTDVVNITRGNASYKARIKKIDEGPFLQVEAVAQEPATYSSTATGAGSSIPTQILQLLSPTQLFLIDSTMLRDEDDNSGFYLALAPTVAAGLWSGAAVYKSSDGVAFDAWDAFTTAVDYGIAVTALGDASGTVTDRGNSLTVQMVRGTLASVSEADMLNGSNAFLLQSGDGWELICAANVTSNGSGSYTLSTFLRGLRGTEHLMDGHAAGDRLIVLSETTLRRILSASEVGLARSYKATTFGAVFDPTGAVSFTNNADGLECYSPTQIKGSRDGSGNLTITAVRRSRIGGDNDWADGVSTVPLGEESEAYEVDIMNGSTVVRTIDGLSSPSASYSAADQTTDFGSAQSAVSVRWYQLSATNGRGTVGSASV